MKPCRIDSFDLYANPARWIDWSQRHGVARCRGTTQRIFRIDQNDFRSSRSPGDAADGAEDSERPRAIVRGEGYSRDRDGHRLEQRGHPFGAPQCLWGPPDIDRSISAE